MLLTLVLFALKGWAQELSCEEKIQTLLIDKVKNYPSNELIPYYSEKDGKWGYIDRKSQKKITEPILSEALFFKPDLSFYYNFETNGEQNGCNGKILSSKEGYKMVDIKPAEYQLFQAMTPDDPSIKKTYKEFVKNSIPGFEVNDKGVLTYFNSKFYDEQLDAPNILEVYALKNKFYGIVKQVQNNQKTFSVINQKGEVMEGYENLTVYPRKIQQYDSGNDIWFRIETGEEEYVLKSLLTKKSIKEKIRYSPNWENHLQNLGYALLWTDDGIGLMVMLTMKWKIKPAKKNDFNYLHYASLEPMEYNYEKDVFSYRPDLTMSAEMIQNNRKKANIYIENNERSFYDLNLKKYQPVATAVK